MTEPRNGKRRRLGPSPVETKDKVVRRCNSTLLYIIFFFFFRLSANRFKSVSSDGVELHGVVDSLASLSILARALHGLDENAIFRLSLESTSMALWRTLKFRNVVVYINEESHSAFSVLKSSRFEI